MEKHSVFLGLGTNIGEKQTNMQKALAEIKRQIGEITSLSSFYETEPVGFESENTFLNAVCRVETILSPYEILAVTQSISFSGIITKSLVSIKGCGMVSSGVSMRMLS